MHRRDLLKKSLATFVALQNVSFAQKSSPATSASSHAPSRVRVVIVGGGWSGLSFAKTILKEQPDADVTLVERRELFISCPVSNAWLFDLVDTSFLTHSYIDAANRHGYRYVRAEATGLRAKENILETTKGDIAYDYLVFATGIEYDYHRWCQDDPSLESQLRRYYPAAFIPGSEHLTLKRKIKNFKKGNFIITVPPGNYRCLPAPYERACLLAEYFQKNKMNAKVIILDANDTVTIKAEGFLNAFKRYKGYLEYKSAVEIETIDLEKRIIDTGFEKIAFADMSFYPDVRAPLLLEKLGLTRATPYNRIEADIDIRTYRFRNHPNIYGIGDIRPMGFSKSGNTAYTEGANVAKIVAAHINRKTSAWVSPVTFCISLVASKPQMEISLVSEYTYGPKGQTRFASTVKDEDFLHNGLGAQKAQFNWAQSMFDNMFYA